MLKELHCNFYLNVLPYMLLAISLQRSLETVISLAESSAVNKGEGGILTKEASSHLCQTAVEANMLEAKLRGFSCG